MDKVFLLTAMKGTYDRESKVLIAFASRAEAEWARALIDKCEPRQTVDIVEVGVAYAHDLAPSAEDAP